MCNASFYTHKDKSVTPPKFPVCFIGTTDEAHCEITVNCESQKIVIKGRKIAVPVK